MHLFVWLSILAWFIVIPITSSGLFYSDFFQYGGVAYQVMATANFWFYLPLTTIIALIPTIVFRLVKLYRQPTYVDFVRLKVKSEGKKLFQQKRMRIVSTMMKQSQRSGYAFSHQEGFGALISSGHIFGMNENNVESEYRRRYSQIRSPSSQGLSELIDGTGNNNLEITTKSGEHLSLSSEIDSLNPSHGVVTWNESSIVSVEVVEEGEKGMELEDEEKDVVDSCNEAESLHKDVLPRSTDNLSNDDDESSPV